MRSSTVLTAAFLTGLAGPALAGGMAPVVVEPAPMAPQPTMAVPVDGDWGGFSVGAALSYGDVSGAGDGDGAMYGLRGGYDFDFGGFVAGVTGSYDWSDIDMGAGDSLDSIARLGVRGGVDLGRTFLYATGGAAWADATVGGLSGTERGWYGGIGAEYKMTDSWSLGGEVLTNRFDDVNGSGIDLDATTVGLNVNMRF